MVEYLTLGSGLIHFFSTEALEEATLNHFDNISCVSSKGVNSPPPAALLSTVAPCSQRAAPNTYRGKEVVNVVAGIQCHADTLCYANSSLPIYSQRIIGSAFHTPA